MIWFPKQTGSENMQPISVGLHRYSPTPGQRACLLARAAEWETLALRQPVPALRSRFPQPPGHPGATACRTSAVTGRRPSIRVRIPLDCNGQPELNERDQRAVDLANATMIVRVA
jgi:hypothetical protein